jgi:hypothetical protein
MYGLCGLAKCQVDEKAEHQKRHSEMKKLRDLYYKTLRTCNLRKIDIFHSKIVPQTH